MQLILSEPPGEREGLLHPCALGSARRLGLTSPWGYKLIGSMSMRSNVDIPGLPAQRPKYCTLASCKLAFSRRANSVPNVYSSCHQPCEKTIIPSNRLSSRLSVPQSYWPVETF